MEERDVLKINDDDDDMKITIYIENINSCQGFAIFMAIYSIYGMARNVLWLLENFVAGYG